MDATISEFRVILVLCTHSWCIQTKCKENICLAFHMEIWSWDYSFLFALLVRLPARWILVSWADACSFQLPEADRCPVLSCRVPYHLFLVRGRFLVGVVKLINNNRDQQVDIDWINHTSMDPKQKDFTVMYLGIGIIKILLLLLHDTDQSGTLTVLLKKYH